jgi:Glycosyl hydrolase family 26
LGETQTEQFEAWLGRPVDISVVFAGRKDWNFMDSIRPTEPGSIAWLLKAWAPNRRLVMSLPLLPSAKKSGVYSLKHAAEGAYNDHYLNAARLLRGRDPSMIIRVGWEMNGDWTPWSACADPEAYIGAFRQLVSTFRSVSRNFRFDWNPNIGIQSCAPDLSYPGDSDVDIVGLDIYEFAKFANGRNSKQIWATDYTRPYGIQWFLDFSRIHKKRMSIPEWGTNLDDGYYVTQLIHFIKMHNVLYHSVWNLNSDAYCLCKNPTNRAVYKTAFGR